MMWRDNRMYKEIRLGGKDQQGEERRRQEAYLQVTPFEVINVKFPSLLPSFPLPSLLHFSPVFSFPLPPHLLPLHSSTSFLSQSLLFMKVNLQVYQELLAGGGLRCSNHNKASPSTWNRKSIVGILGYFHCHTLHTIAHSHLPLSANEHPCFLPASFPKALLSPSCSSQVVHCFVFFFFFYFFFFLALHCSIQHFLQVYKEQLSSGGLHFLTSTCRTVFHTLLL